MLDDFVLGLWVQKFSFYYSQSIMNKSLENDFQEYRQHTNRSTVEEVVRCPGAEEALSIKAR